MDCLAADLSQPIREERTKYIKNIIQFNYDITFNLKNIEHLNALSDMSDMSTVRFLLLPQARPREL